MTRTVYTLGYSGRKPEQILAWLEHHQADLFDIRFSPFSRHAMWTSKGLKEVVGARYHHVKALGNKNYKSDGPIELLDWASGLALIEVNPHPVILMCGCADARICHRTVVAQLLKVSGYQVMEIPPGLPSKQGVMF